MVATAVAVPVAEPLRVICAEALNILFDDTDAEPYLALSTEIVVVALAFAVALPIVVKFADAVVVDVTLDVALTFLITEPFAVVLTAVVDTPLIRAEPSGTLRALQVTLELDVIVALAFLSTSSDAVTVDVEEIALGCPIVTTSAEQVVVDDAVANIEGESNALP